jgi:hypothetical protein
VLLDNAAFYAEWKIVTSSERQKAISSLRLLHIALGAAPGIGSKSRTRKKTNPGKPGFG